LQIS